jgi:hypothetical protein
MQYAVKTQPHVRTVQIDMKRATLLARNTELGKKASIRICPTSVKNTPKRIVALLTVKDDFGQKDHIKNLQKDREPHTTITSVGTPEERLIDIFRYG